MRCVLASGRQKIWMVFLAVARRGVHVWEQLDVSVVHRSECAYCGESFKSKYSHKKYCGSECQDKAKALRDKLVRES